MYKTVLIFVLVYIQSTQSQHIQKSVVISTAVSLLKEINKFLVDAFYALTELIGYRPNKEKKNGNKIEFEPESETLHKILDDVFGALKDISTSRSGGNVFGDILEQLLPNAKLGDLLKQK